MARRSRRGDPETLRSELEALVRGFKDVLRSKDPRTRVQGLVPAFHKLRDLGSSLAPGAAEGARDRILAYLRRYPLTVIKGDELMVVAGIQDYPRRVRELRVQFGWRIASGAGIVEMIEEEGELTAAGVDLGSMTTDDYILLDEVQDREAAHRWHEANEIRKRKGSVQNKLLAFLRANVTKPVSNEELRYVAANRTEWARRVRELRTEQGWPVSTRNTGRPELPIGVYVLEADRQSPPHDRRIPDPVRRQVLHRDGYRCVRCGWSKEVWTRSDPRNLELHHVKPHAERGANTASNLETVCTVCHDEIHGSGSE